MNKNLTAVEWLILELTDDPYHFLFLCDKPDYMLALEKVINKAKQLEKQQIIEAYEEGCFDSILDEKTDKARAEDYYNETFKN